MDRIRTVLILDGQGGGVGSQLVKLLKPRLPEDCRLLCVGTNVAATSAMLRAGAAQGATGENAVVYNAAQADLILGPIGVVLANGILGEVSPAMAAAVTGAGAVKILIPSSSCGVYVAGVEECRLEEYLRRAVDLAARELGL
ncbi:DUF3842 family protein [uncultured Oscillibacter sp.]|uniref:DUF3842 family protein n=1 Tax=uncultured Oscillibacter sp. TaxID=876091 RepID=UPI0025F5B8A7|nr:DUF3842 family protein [uncultured Oscillibacter sp.]